MIDFESDSAKVNKILKSKLISCTASDKNLAAKIKKTVSQALSSITSAPGWQV